MTPIPAPQKSQVPIRGRMHRTYRRFNAWLERVLCSSPANQRWKRTRCQKQLNAPCIPGPLKMADLAMINNFCSEFAIYYYLCWFTNLVLWYRPCKVGLCSNRTRNWSSQGCRLCRFCFEGGRRNRFRKHLKEQNKSCRGEVARSVGWKQGLLWSSFSVDNTTSSRPKTKVRIKKLECKPRPPPRSQPRKPRLPSGAL